ncbi:MAG: hypothetical protein LBK97_08170 [Prevotellaceae bacterium]|jgi:hypothetical protein|nr:hypothetical protein [Prevotellaceae bacterium]
MKTIINLLVVPSVCILFSFAVSAQGTAPVWLNPEVRNMQYPPETYYTGYSECSAANGEGQEKVLNRAKQTAVGELSERVRVTVNTQKSSIDASISGSDIEERILSEFTSTINTASQTEIVGSQVQTHYNARSNTAYAFAYVSKAGLIDYYRKQINLDLNSVDLELEISMQLIALGKKISASQNCSEIRGVFDNILNCQKILIAVGADKDALQIERSKSLQQQVSQLLLSLEQSTYVYVDCRFERKGGVHDAFSSDPGIICDIVKQAISENDCSVTDNKAEADYELTLIASTTQRSDGTGNSYGIISYYANVKGTLYNRIVEKKTADFIILNDPEAYAAGKSPEAAATKAFKLPALKNRILEKILPKIKN